jgi:hypothetical protein
MDPSKKAYETIYLREKMQNIVEWKLYILEVKIVRNQIAWRRHVFKVS